MDVTLPEKVYQVLAALPPGERCTKAQMVTKLHASERWVRKAVEELRRDGVRVISGCGESGYRLATDDADYRRFRAEYIAHAAAQYEVVRAMDANITGQIKFELRRHDGV